MWRLLTHPTVDLLVKFGLGGMARAFTELQTTQSAADLGHAEWLAFLGRNPNSMEIAG